MTDLHEQLTRLADRSTADAAAPDPDGAWSRGRSRQRAQRLSAVAVAAALVVAGVLAAAPWQRAEREIAPAGASDALRLPDAFHDVSPWLPATEEPIGPLSAVLGGYRGDWTGGGTNGIVGVSSTTGEYAFLDLPGWDDGGASLGGSDVALSPDGRHLAWWSLGSPSGEPNTTTGGPFTGFAVLDTSTGDVERVAIETEHGINPSSIVWGADVLWLEWSQLQDVRGGYGVGSGVQTWRVGDTEPTAYDGRQPLLFDTTATGGLLVESTGGRQVDLVSPEGSRRVQVDQRLEGPAALNPAGDLLAVTLDPDRAAMVSDEPRSVAVAEVEADAGTDTGTDGATLRTLTTPEDGLEAVEVVGWRDDEHLVVLARRDGVPGAVYVSVDASTGETEPLVQGSPTSYAPGVVVAEDAWQGVLFDAPEPPSPMDPRLQWGLVAGVLLLGGLALVVGRRRARV